MIKICPICKKEFNCRKEQILCGVVCAAIWRSETMKDIKHTKFHKKEIICPVCGECFIPKRKEQQTCSVKCGHKVQFLKISGENNGNYNENLIYKSCFYCGKQFRPDTTQLKRGTGKYCSKKCCDLAKIKPKMELKCLECGKIFKRDRWKVDFYTKMYCSRKCYTKNFNLRSYKVDLMIEWLDELDVRVEEEKTFTWLKGVNGYNLYLDLFIPKYSIAIEYDGKHHFKPTFKGDNNNTVSYRQELDNIKNTLCNEHDINLIRFSYDEDFNKEYFFRKLKLWYSPTPKDNLGKQYGSCC